MRIALCARVTTKDKGPDYENQLRELRAFVDRKRPDGWELGAEFVDTRAAPSLVGPSRP